MTTPQSRSVIVTGAGSGIGRAIAEAFVANGDRVVVADLAEDAAEAVAAALGPDAVALRSDVSKEEDVAAAVALAVDRFGGLDVMVNNAGIGGMPPPITQATVEDFDQVVGVLLKGVFLGIKHAAVQMIAQGRGGAIVNMSSIAGLTAGCGGHAYSACKAGVLGLTRTTSLELAEHRIRVNSICPGGIVTPLLVGLPPATPVPAELYPHFDRSQPWPEHGTPEDIAEATVWLASPGARFMTGQALTIDGGIHAGGPLGIARIFANAIEEAAKNGAMPA